MRTSAPTYVPNVDLYSEIRTNERFSTQAVKNQIAEAQKIASGSGSEQDIAEAKIELEVSRIHASLVEQNERSANILYRCSRPSRLTSNKLSDVHIHSRFQP